ncbi:YaiI/YqxD family protein [Cellulosilyticum sp. I15G10I2]|uniref:YaiI/YqxD family protein n=1 Tax=Cellulosilyticum sp. I15G10I2 TaxID=1892843 RepID=UPI00085C3ED8|nr:YaiI/YqxD family protein [Cellulosilyticum sp. I15G10I2]
MKILIDADGCPVVDIVISIAKIYNIQVLIFCDTAHSIEREGAITKVISKGADAVDFVLVNEVQAGDIVVTQDYGLAAMVLSKKGHPINQNGMIYTEENIDQLLFTRHLAKKVRSSGGHIKGPKKRIKENNEAFKKGLTKLVLKVSNRL